MAVALPKGAKVWRPQRGPQTAYFESTVDELCYGGAAGGGKSDSILTDAIVLCQQYSGYKAIIFRRLYPDLERSLIPIAREKMVGRAVGRNGGKVWNFDNGSTLRLSHLQHEEDKEDHKSAEYDFIGFDELTTFSESQYTYLFSRLRGAKKVPRLMRSGTNPTGPGHSWVKDRFVEPGAATKEDLEPFKEVTYEFAYGWEVDGKVYTDFSSLPEEYAKGKPVFSREVYQVWKSKKSGVTRAFIPSLLWSNEILLKSDPKYVNRLRELPLKQQTALLYGKWSIMEGQFFSEWDPEVHTCDPFDIPKHWERYVGIDYGFTAPFAALFFAVDPQGKVYAYRELYGSKHETSDQAKLLLDSMEQGEKIEWFAADPAMWQSSGHGESHAQIYDRYGISLTPSSNKRIPGWSLLHEYLLKQKLVVFKNCDNLIRTLPSLVHSPSNPEDLDTKQEDHACFSFDTLVDTPFGKRRIDSLKVNDFVFTSQGFQRINYVGSTKKEDLFSLVLQNGKEILATADHKFLTTNGWKKLEDIDIKVDFLIQSDICFKSYLKLFKNLMVSAITYVEDTFNTMVNACMLLYGKSLLALRKKVFKFITKTGIARIIPLKILSCFLPSNICLSMHEILVKIKKRKEDFTSRKSVQRLPLGIDLSKVECGIESTQPNPQKSGKKFQSIVLFVKKNLKLLNSLLFGRFTAVLIVDKLRCGKEEVYDLSVPSTGNFTIHDGIVVSNCDATRYFLSTLRGGATHVPMTKEGIVLPEWWSIVKYKQSQRKRLQRIRL